MNFFLKFALLYLEILVKGQFFIISGSQFLKWVFGLKKFTDFRETGPRVPEVKVFLRARGELESHERRRARKTSGPMDFDPIFALFTLDQSHRTNHA